MFQMLIAYDLVIADISIHNANVFYELGIRHGLRPKGTILIRFPASGADVPFDLKTDRYIEYDRENPAAAVQLLARSIRDTRNAMAARIRSRTVRYSCCCLSCRRPIRRNSSWCQGNSRRRSSGPRTTRSTADRCLPFSARRRSATNGRAEGCGCRPRATPGRELQGGAPVMGIYPQGPAAGRRGQPAAGHDLSAPRRPRLGVTGLSSRTGGLTAERKDRADARSQLARNEKASWVDNFAKIPASQGSPSAGHRGQPAVHGIRWIHGRDSPRT